MKFNLADNEPFLVEGSSKSVNVLDLITTETDPVFLASAAANITTSDISNWNSKTDNVGTITGITMNGASKGTSGVVDLGTVITSETQLSKGTTTGSGNAVTDISVSDHQITLTKGITFVTSGDLSAYATDLTYNRTRGTLELMHERNTIASIDVTPFIKDGMVSSVTVGTPSSGINVGLTCLIITFNTDAGQNQIELPISQIFDADDYYTKDDIDNAGYVTSLKTINNETITGTGNINVVTLDYLAQNYVHKPDVIYQYETGMSQIYGQASSSITNTWDLTNLDLSPYKYIKVFIKGGNGNNSDSGMTSPIIVTIPLDSGIISGGATYYSGAGITAGINNHNRMWIAFCAVDSTKTKFQLVRTISLYGTAGTDASDGGRFLYRIEGWYDSEEAETGGNVPFTELDPTVPSYVKNITQQDITNWNSYANLDKVPQVSGTAAATATIDPYKLYDFGTLSTAMTVSFNTAAEVTGYAKEYIIRFVAGNGCALTLPNGVLYNGGAAPTYVTGRTYEIDIVNNCAAVAEFY